MKPIRDTFTIELADEDFEVDVGDLIAELKVDPNDPSDDLRTQSARFAWIAVLTAQAESETNKVKQDLAVVKATIGREARADADDQGGKKPTEAAIAEGIVLNKRVRQLTDAFEEASRRATILAAIREAYRQRRDMLGALAYSTRQRERAEE